MLKRSIPESQFELRSLVSSIDSRKGMRLFFLSFCTILLKVGKDFSLTFQKALNQRARSGVTTIERTGHNVGSTGIDRRS